jgi:hypothetical protein
VGQDGPLDSATRDLLEKLIDERTKIIDSQLCFRQKRKLIHDNWNALAIVRGGRIIHSRSLVYGILFFSMVVILAGLVGTYLKPDNNNLRDVTLSITGSVVGATIATIAQKLGAI